MSIANSAAPLVSPTNRIPSGPNASGPADFRSGVPFLRLAVGSAPRANAAVKHTPASAIATMRKSNSRHVRFSFDVEPVGFHRCQTHVLRNRIIAALPEESTSQLGIFQGIRFGFR